jgi:predicted dehydrogenase
LGNRRFGEVGGTLIPFCTKLECEQQTPITKRIAIHVLRRRTCGDLKMPRVKIGVVGAGMIAQIEHIPNLVRLRDEFEVVGVSDPSPSSRSFVRDILGVPAYATADVLYDKPLDAVLIASPDPLHHGQVLTALKRGLHVFCEKPLCYSPGEIDEIIGARDVAGKVVQVGYMKRFDPHYEAALAAMPGTAKTLRYVSVEVNDPDAWPFVRQHAYHREADVPEEVVEEARLLQREQIARAVQAPLDEMATRGFAAAYCSSLVHDVNAVHGLLDALSIPDGSIVGAQLFAGGDGGQGAVKLLDGRALWNMVHLAVPAVADYRETISLYFDDAILNLVFPSPWLNNQATQLVIRKSNGHVLQTIETNAGFEEAYVRELVGFHNAIVDGAVVRNTAEHARRDQALLCGLAAWHATRSK